VSQSTELTHTHLLARNVLLNLLGYGTPLLAALVAIPFIIKTLGTDRFGILTLAWVIIGYLGLLDLGLGRALTQLVAEKLGNDKGKEIPSLIWTAMSMMLVVSGLISIIAVLLSSMAVRYVLKIPMALHAETIRTFYLLSLSVPIIILSAASRGVLEAYQRFDYINGIRIPLGIYSFIAPLIVLPFTQNLFYVVMVLVIGKIAGCITQFYMCVQTVPQLKNKIDITLAHGVVLIRCGGWMTVSNVINPLLVYLDRFFIGAMLSVTAVAYYATPHEMVTKLLLIPGSLMGVLFPAFSTSFRLNPDRSKKIMQTGVKYIFLVVFPITLFIITFGKELLYIWLGVAFAQNSTGVLQWIAAGVFILSLSQGPYAMIQGAGRPDLTAKLHAIEFIIYIPMLIFFAMFYQIKGVAFTWVLRSFVDLAGMYLISLKLLRVKISEIKKGFWSVIFSFPVFLIASILSDFRIKLFFFLLIIALFAFSVWYYFLVPEEKELIVHKIFQSKSQQI